MIKLFNRNKVDINSITIPNFGWNEDKKDLSVKYWINPEQTMALSTNFFHVQPDLPTLKDLEHLRAFYRSQIVAVHGGLIEVEKIKLGAYDAIRTIFKIPQEPTGMTYLASLTIPFESCSYVVKIQAPEIGATGMRNSVVADKLMNEGLISMGENGFDGWCSDPYNPEFTEGALMDKSEDEQYDADFPEHPLTQARKLLREIEQNIAFKPELEKVKKFDK